MDLFIVLLDFASDNASWSRMDCARNCCFTFFSDFCRSIMLIVFSLVTRPCDDGRTKETNWQNLGRRDDFVRPSANVVTTFLLHTLCNSDTLINRVVVQQLSAQWMCQPNLIPLPSFALFAIFHLQVSRLALCPDQFHWARTATTTFFHQLLNCPIRRRLPNLTTATFCVPVLSSVLSVSLGYAFPFTVVVVSRRLALLFHAVFTRQMAYCNVCAEVAHWFD